MEDSFYVLTDGLALLRSSPYEYYGFYFFNIVKNTYVIEVYLHFPIIWCH